MIHTVELKCEYARNPLAIETVHPRLSWVLEHAERGQAQTAFQILAASSLELLSEEDADLWDSGKVQSPHTIIGYAGYPLTSRMRCCWKVRAWDKEGRPGPYSDPAWFEMGLLRPGDWKAEWVGHPAGQNGGALYFRKDFTLKGPVKRARAYVCGLGLAEFRLNGVKIGDRVLEPAETSYARKVLYSTFDVQAYLKEGANTAGIIIGSGWYGHLSLLFQMEIETQDGAVTTICSGSNFLSNPWSVSRGPILQSSLYDGETYDARLEVRGWDQPEDAENRVRLSAMKRTSPAIVEGPGGRLVSQTMEPIRVIQSLPPKTLSQPRPGVFVCDFGQNFAGWARLQVSGPRGAQIILRFAETLREDGTVNQENLRSARATDVYILKGEGLEIWEPRFTYHGFRYVEMEGFPGQPDLNTLRGQVVRSDVEPASEFHCSSQRLNQIYEMVRWTESSNLHGLPTDCPQRDERMGWLNDMAARTEEALFNFDVQRLFSKWTGDIEDAQDPTTGAITDTAPYHWGNRPADPVSQAYLIVPWMLFIHNGDGRTLAEHYDGMKKWTDYLTGQARGHILDYSYYGDWAPPIGEGLLESIGSSAVSKNTPGALVSTAFYYYAAHLIYQFAGIVGKAKDKEEYAALMDAIEDAFNARFWDEAAGGYGTNNQACNALPLYLNIVPEERKKRVLDNLVHDVVDLHAGHLTTGNLCTKYLLEALSEGGRADVAYQVVNQETYPSWGYMLANGATTLWERWELATGSGMNSHNHPMLGSVGAWIIKTAAGLVPDLHFPAFEDFIVRPRLTNELDHARVSLKTVRGRVEVGWEQNHAGLSIRVTVPTGSRARVYIPKPAGNYTFAILESGKPVWQNGAPTGSFPEINLGESEKDFIGLRIGSGCFDFLRVIPGKTAAEAKPGKD